MKDTRRRRDDIDNAAIDDPYSYPSTSAHKDNYYNTSDENVADDAVSDQVMIIVCMYICILI